MRRAFFFLIATAAQAFVASPAPDHRVDLRFKIVDGVLQGAILNRRDGSEDRRIFVGLPTRRRLPACRSIVFRRQR